MAERGDDRSHARSPTAGPSPGRARSWISGYTFRRRCSARPGPRGHPALPAAGRHLPPGRAGRRLRPHRVSPSTGTPARPLPARGTSPTGWSPVHPTRHQGHRGQVRRRHLPPLPGPGRCTRSTRPDRTPPLPAAPATSTRLARRPAPRRPTRSGGPSTIRAGVEGTIHQAVPVAGIRRARYLGLPKTTWSTSSPPLRSTSSASMRGGTATPSTAPASATSPASTTPSPPDRINQQGRESAPLPARERDDQLQASLAASTRATARSFAAGSRRPSARAFSRVSKRTDRGRVLGTRRPQCLVRSRGERLRRRLGAT